MCRCLWNDEIAAAIFLIFWAGSVDFVWAVAAVAVSHDKTNTIQKS
jgi:hypothetical protein